MGRPYICHVCGDPVTHNDFAAGDYLYIQDLQRDVHYECGDDLAFECAMCGDAWSLDSAEWLVIDDLDKWNCTDRVPPGLYHIVTRAALDGDIVLALTGDTVERHGRLPGGDYFQFGPTAFICKLCAERELLAQGIVSRWFGAC